MEAFLESLYKDQHPENTLLLILIFSVLVFMTVFLAIILVQVGNLYNKIQAKNGGRKWQQGIIDFWNGFYIQQAGFTPIAAENDLMLDHNYDDIKELDNHLPPWWKNLFYVTVGFSAVYMFMFHFTGNWDLQIGEYKQQLADAEIQKKEWEKTQTNSINETNAKFLADAKTMEEGKAIFTSNCVACHGKDAGGGVGPNLTDDYWLHGNKVTDVFKTVKYGVPGKGMTAWQANLNPKQIQAVSSYVLSLHGSVPAMPKEPQGQLITDNYPTSGKSSTNISPEVNKTMTPPTASEKSTQETESTVANKDANASVIPQ